MMRLRERLTLLQMCSHLIGSSWHLMVRKFKRSRQCRNAFEANSLREMISPSVYNLPLVRTLHKTMTTGMNAIPQVNILRASQFHDFFHENNLI